MKYRSDIDGLRALAIIPVVLYHNKVGSFSGGFVGVDIFFVISGYLITSIINNEIIQNTFTIRSFYERRIRRIFPAFFAVIIFSAIISSIQMLPWNFEEFGKSIVAASFFIANIFFWLETNYFGPAAETMPLLHTWSLSVEEQFYLFFPPILLLIYKYFKSYLKPAILSIALLSFIINVWGINQYPTATFYLISSRAWELLLGSLLAIRVLPQLKHQILQDFMSILGFVLIIWSIFSFSQATPFPGIYALAPCIGAALIIYSGDNSASIIGKILSFRPIIFIGLISYSLYLWHWPLIVFSKQFFYEKPGPYNSIIIILITFLISVLSWLYIEKPFRNKNYNIYKKNVFPAALAITIFCVIVGYTIRSNDGWPSRFGDKLVSFTFDSKKYNLDTCFLNDKQHFSEWKEDTCFIQSDKLTNTILWGDSFAAHYIPGIKSNLNLINSNLLQYNASGCAPSFNYDPDIRKQCKKFSGNLFNVIEKYNIDTIILSADWNLAIKQGFEFSDLKHTINLIRKKGLKVYLIGQSPRFDSGVQEINYYSNINADSVSKSLISVDLHKINSNLEKIAGSNNFINPSDLFCIKQTCHFKDTNDFYFWDDGHYTTYGSKLAAQYIFTKFKL